MYRFTCLVLVFLASNAIATDIAGHQAGIWSIESTHEMKRWIIIHNLESAATSGVYHIEVIGRKNDSAEWQVEHLVRHMAITEKALLASINKPLKKGGVYPESFNDAFALWQREGNGNGGAICDLTVIECM